MHIQKKYRECSEQQMRKKYQVLTENQEIQMFKDM